MGRWLPGLGRGSSLDRQAVLQGVSRQAGGRPDIMAASNRLHTWPDESTASLGYSSKAWPGWAATTPGLSGRWCWCRVEATQQLAMTAEGCPTTAHVAARQWSYSLLCERGCSAEAQHHDLAVIRLRSSCGATAPAASRQSGTSCRREPAHAGLSTPADVHAPPANRHAQGRTSATCRNTKALPSWYEVKVLSARVRTPYVATQLASSHQLSGNLDRRERYCGNCATRATRHLCPCSRPQPGERCRGWHTGARPMGLRGQPQAKLDVADEEGLLQTKRCERLHAYNQISRADSRVGLLTALHKAFSSLDLGCCFIQGPLE